MRLLIPLSIFIIISASGCISSVQEDTKSLSDAFYSFVSERSKELNYNISDVEIKEEVEIGDTGIVIATWKERGERGKGQTYFRKEGNFWKPYFPNECIKQVSYECVTKDCTISDEFLCLNKKIFPPRISIGFFNNKSGDIVITHMDFQGKQVNCIEESTYSNFTYGKPIELIDYSINCDKPVNVQCGGDLETDVLVQGNTYKELTANNCNFGVGKSFFVFDMTINYYLKDDPQSIKTVKGRVQFG